jgi:class 3 adenylate cyclase
MTVLFTDVVDSTKRAAELGDRRWRELASAHDDEVRAQLGRFRGREIKMMGDGFLASFGGPRARSAAREPFRSVPTHSGCPCVWDCIPASVS